jgi:hypothetical protein
MEPNIFKIATKELSQDAFFVWLFQWADENVKSENKALIETSKDLIRLLINQNSDYAINKVVVFKQWHNIDICVQVNEEYFVVIEDKTGTHEHSKQLERYKAVAENYNKDKNFKLCLIYLKTGNESLSRLKQITAKDYIVIDRGTVLSIISKQQIQNDILNDFKEYLTEIENQTNSFEKSRSITKNWRACEGFYMDLQSKVNDWADWGYVANPTGGFLGFWYYFRKTEEINQIYIQIENSFERGFKVVLKIAGFKADISTLRKVFIEIAPIAQKNNISITKPDKFRAGATSTLMVVTDAFKVDENGDFDLNEFVSNLKKLEKTIDDYCGSKK